MPTNQIIEGYTKLSEDKNLHKDISSSKPSINFFEESKHYSYNLAIARSRELIYYWKNNNPSVPDFIDTFQEKALVEMLALFLKGKNFQLLAGTGTGKTYMMFYLLDIICYYGYFEQLHKIENTVYPFPSVMFVPASVVEQSNEVKKLFPNIKNNCIVTNYETLRTKKGLGNVWIESKIETNGEDIYEVINWRKEFSPAVAFFDENQKLKNNNTRVTRLVQEYCNTLSKARNIRYIFASASPFTRPIESKTVALGLQCYLDTGLLCSLFKTDSKNLSKVLSDIKGDELQSIEQKYNLPRISSSNFKHWLDNYICLRSTEYDYSPAAMERITDYLATEHQIVQVNDVKFKHKTMNKHVLLDFQSEDERKQYELAYQEYIKELSAAKLETIKRNQLVQIWIAQTKFRQKAEYIRAELLVKLALEREETYKENVIIATAYQETQTRILEIIKEKYPHKLHLVSYIRGGQSKKARWENINKFQDEKTTIMLLMLQAGGVGLSLHHHKPRNKRPRFVLMPPVWSVIDMLQVLGRAHRINSESTTHQWIVWYRGTVEEDVCKRLKEKSLSMRELMRRKESWSELFVESSVRYRLQLKSELKSELSEISGGRYENKYNNNNIDIDDEDDNVDDSKDFFNMDEQMVSENIVEEQE